MSSSRPYGRRTIWRTGACGQTRKEKNSFRSQPEEEMGFSGQTKGSVLQAGPRGSHQMC